MLGVGLSHTGPEQLKAGLGRGGSKGTWPGERERWPWGIGGEYRGVLGQDLIKGMRIH